MSIPNVSGVPRVWTDRELAEQAQKAIDVFVERRLAEPQDRYLEHVALRKKGILKLFRTLEGVDPANPPPEKVREILLDSAQFDALRYVAGPPVSKDDLDVLVLRTSKRITRELIKHDDPLVLAVLSLICKMADPIRFPWIAARRKPALYEIKQAIRATTALHATQTLQTERRGYGKEVERLLAHRLVADLKFERRTSPNRGKIKSPTDFPAKGTFYGECTVYGRKCDLLIALPDGRMVAVEAKDSSSVVNSVKRVLNDTAAKAEHWHKHAGRIIVPVALLSGVFGVENLKSAQASGLYLVWAHDLDSFVNWVSAQ